MSNNQVAGVDRYVLNITNWPVKCFNLVDKRGRVIAEIEVFEDRCHGKLIGVYHASGWKAERDFMAANETWHEDHREVRGEHSSPFYCDDNGIPETPWEPDETEDWEDDAIWD